MKFSRWRFTTLIARNIAVTVCFFFSCSLQAQTSVPAITTPNQALGFNIGDDYQVANYSQLESYWKTLDAESDRMTLVDIGQTAEGRHQWMAIVSSPENLAKLKIYQETSRQLALGKATDGAPLSETQAQALARTGKAVVWIDGGLHANETVGSQQLIEMVYQMVSRTDRETMRFLDDVIQLYVLANPDGQELIANWYMREPDPLKRSLNNVPRLYQKYVGHDDNRDFFLSSQPETTNMNRQMFIEWFPQIVYNHHQTGPAGSVVFIPPFRDPFNYNLDPLIPLGIEMVGTAMHSRLVEEGKGGSNMRSGANYSTWWNGGLRTIAYFHNMIGLLTEIIGSPTPIDIPLIADKQLPQGDLPMPVAPGKWHYRRSIDYEISQNRAVLDYASRYRETLLMNIYRMARNSIDRGNRDSWTVTPKRIEALRAAPLQPNGASGNRLAPELYDTLLHAPEMRDARGYIISFNQPDPQAARTLVESLRKTGVQVLAAVRPFEVNGKSYPRGSYIVKTNQAFRPHILDMFEPQDHPNDFRYPGGPPNPPYDITGWTLAMQMGVQFDRILDAFDGPFQDGADLPAVSYVEPVNEGSDCLDHRQNQAFTMVNRLLKSGQAVSWFESDGAFCVPAGKGVHAILADNANVAPTVHVLATAPSGSAYKLHPVRIGLYDQYGGLVTSGWTRWILEQFEFPYEIVYPQILDAGDLRKKFDVLLITDEGYRGMTRPPAQPAAETIPLEYRSWLGSITNEKTVPQLKAFVEAGGTLLTIGSSTALGTALGLPVSDYLVQQTPTGATRPLSREQFYIPGSLLRVKLDTANPLTQGMSSDAIVVFDNSPVFRVPTGPASPVKQVARYDGIDSLASGWAWGQQYLDGGTAIAEATLGQGRVVMFGPEIAFRGQSQGTFKLLFNGILLGAAEHVVLP